MWGVVNFPLKERIFKLILQRGGAASPKLAYYFNTVSRKVFTNWI